VPDTIRSICRQERGGVALVRSREARLVALVAAVFLAMIALLLCWNLYGPDMVAPKAMAQGETGTCTGAQLIDEFTGNGDQQTSPFQIETDSFRVSYEATNDDPSLGFLSIRVLPEGEDISVGNATQDGPGTGQTFVNEGPGTYALEISASNLEYTINVEECGEGGSSPKTSPSPPPKTNPSPPPRPSPARTPNPAPAPRPTPPPQPSPAPPPDSGTLFKAGGSTTGALPLMPNGSCPKEYPVKQGKACYR
jgi:hypothetical protein